MNENNQLEPHESILLMEDASHGKSVGGTRVFKSFAELAAAYPAMKLVTVTGKVGDVVETGVVKTGWHWPHPKSKAGQVFTTKVAQEGFRIDGEPYGQLYIASSTQPPKRFRLAPEHFGYQSYKEKISYKKV